MLMSVELTMVLYHFLLYIASLFVYNRFVKYWRTNGMSTLKDKKLFLLDMDGTIYLDDDLFD